MWASAHATAEPAATATRLPAPCAPLTLRPAQRSPAHRHSALAVNPADITAMDLTPSLRQNFTDVNGVGTAGGRQGCC